MLQLYVMNWKHTVKGLNNYKTQIYNVSWGNKSME